MSAGGSASGSTAALDLTVVVPAYNEGRRLVEGVARLLAAVADGAVAAEHTEIVVVDDGSTDDTAPVARALLAALPHVRVIGLPENAGKGAAVRAGVAAASARACAYMDADMAIDPDQIPLLTGALESGDMAIGSRTQPGSHAEGATVTRTVMGRLFTGVVNRTTNVGFGDTQCGFKGFRTPVARTLFHLGAVNGFAFDVELLSLAARLGFRVAEVPVRWRHVPGSRIRPLADALAMARDVQRSRSGQRHRPPIPTLTVPPDGRGGAGDACRQALAAAGPALPVLADVDGGARILFPLCRPADLSAVGRRLEAEAPGTTALAGELTFAQLTARAPLRFAELGPTRVQRPPAPTAQDGCATPAEGSATG